MFTRFSLRDYNFKLLITVIIAMICGVVMINSADSSFTPKQTIGIGLGVIIMIFVSLLNYDFVCRFYRVFFIINAVILLSVIFFGVEVNYAKRWIMIGGSGGIQFQPSEFSKILMILFTATFLDKLKEDNKINTLKGLCLFVLLIGLSLALIAVEPDLSTTLCLAMVLVTMLYLSGLSYKIIGIALLVFVPLAGSFLWYIQRPNQHLLRDYQVNRILQFIYPGQYGSDYTQQNNSVMAIGSGQLTGKGLNNNTTTSVKNGNFILEPQTDFIFAVVGEELGFIGCVIVIVLLLLIVFECILIAKNAKDLGGRLICCGMAALIGFQSFINICVTTGLMPNTGLPLPFVSYGLTSLMSLFIGLGLVLNVGLQARKYHGLGDIE
jgi:rod shape determining protein RodA